MRALFVSAKARETMQDESTIDTLAIEYAFSDDDNESEAIVAMLILCSERDNHVARCE